MLLGIVVLLGWQLGDKVLYGLIPGLPPMVPNTALGFILSGTSLWLLAGKGASRLRIYTGQVLAAGTLFIGVLTMVEYLNIMPMVSIDRLLVSIFSQAPFVLRPSPHTAIAFSIAGLALVLLGAGKNQLMILIQWLSILMLMIAAVVFFGYIYGEISFYAYSGAIGMAMHTAAGFILLALGILMVGRETGLMRYFTDTTAGGLVMRRMFPAILLVPLSLGGLEIMGHKAGLYTDPFGISLLQILSLIVMAIIVAHVARIVNREESLKQDAEEKARQRQVELAHMDRLHTMSEMATGIAHEVNQPLTAITTNAFTCQRVLGAMDNVPQDVLKSLDRICSETKLAVGIIHRVREFVRKESPNKSIVILNDLIWEVVNFIDDELRSHNVQVELMLDKQIPKLTLDAIQIEQVLLNIVRNAIDAMQLEEAKEKRLTISTYVNKEHYVEIDICDTGPGMDSNTLSKIFESFFTTKSAEGMGMGLSISRSIIEAHGGRIWAESTPSVGTCFSIILPPE